jgi:hypothetical protein
MSAIKPASDGRARQRSPRRILGALAVLILTVAIFYAILFVRVVPPRLVQVVDAVTGRPLAGMNVCLQAVAPPGWSIQALRSKVQTTDANGRTFFLPSVVNLVLLKRLDGYAIQVTDPKSDFAETCGPQVGFTMSNSETEKTEKFIRISNARSDGSQHFPVELVKRENIPKNILWFPFMRGTDFHSSMSVQLVPVLPTPDGCKKISDPLSLAECSRLNMMAQDALVQDLLPMYFAGMQRATIQILGGSIPAARIYNAIYDGRSVPQRYTDVLIEQFPDARSATEHFGDLSHAIGNYDLSSVTEDESIPGQKIRRITSEQNPRAFWMSGSRLILVTFIPSTPEDRLLIAQWLRRNPSTMESLVP